MLEAQETKEASYNRIERVIEQMKELRGGTVQESCPIGIISMENWEWPQGVGLFSLYLYYKETGKREILEYLIEWYDRRIQEGLPEKNINTMCPMLTLTYVYEETGRADYLALCKEWVEYAMNELPRTEENGFQHVGTGHLNEGQLWDDTLYMTVLFVCRMGQIDKRDDYIQESIRQFLVHLKYLTDPVTGLFFHGWTFVDKHHYSRALWGRGNAWYTAGLVDYLEMAELPQGVQWFLLSSLERQIQKLQDVQAKSGMWHTLLDDPASYEETSATAGFAYGILKAIRKNMLPAAYKPVAVKAYKAVLRQIDEQGVVHGVSYGTGLGRSLQVYRDIPITPMAYGQSMVLLMLVESLKHDELSGEG
ncbi:beta-galactosidase BglB [Paenibacillus agaridevorans]|nr:glycoside hydrolase family 88 protein [Paenibacillus agaridevorans]